MTMRHNDIPGQARHDTHSSVAGMPEEDGGHDMHDTQFDIAPTCRANDIPGQLPDDTQGPSAGMPEGDGGQVGAATQGKAAPSSRANDIPGQQKTEAHAFDAGMPEEDGGHVGDDTQRPLAPVSRADDIPGHSSVDTQMRSAGTRDQGGPSRVLPPNEAMSRLVSDIREEHRLHEDYRRAAASLHLRMCAIIRRLTGCSKSESPKILKQVFAPHTRNETRDAAEREEQGSNLKLTPNLGMSPEKLLLLLAPMMECREPLLVTAKSYRKTLERLAQELPIWPWVEGIRGFGALGLAQIIGEAGDLSDYENPAKLWKRMGLAVVGGERQRRHVDAEKAKEHGYSPKRRAIMWNIGCSLIKLNDGKYREFYDSEKARQMVRLELPDDKPGHAHKRAQRHMEKLLLKDFWREWNHKAADTHRGDEPLAPELLEVGAA